MKEKRRKFSSLQKVSIVREHLEGGYSLSSVCEKYQIHPPQLTRWKTQLFEGGVAIFSGIHAKSHHRFALGRIFLSIRFSIK
jgi:transposase-like protein